MIRTFASRLVIGLALGALMIGIIADHSRAQSGWGVPLYVQNASNAPAINQPVASGIAIPRGSGIKDPNAVLAVRDPFGNSVPVQFKVLSRWDGERGDATKDVKWILVEFRGSAAAEDFAAYRIGFGQRSQGALTITDYPGQLIVNTGPSQFVLDKNNFSIFSQVYVAGQNVLAQAGVLQMHDVWETMIDPLQTELVVEEVGSVRAVIRQRGILPGLGLQFTNRYTFWSGSREVTVDFRLENDGGYGALSGMGQTEDHAYFSDCAIGFVLGGDHQSYVTPNATYANSTAYELRQDFETPSQNTDMHSGFEYREWTEAGLADTGNRYEGALAINADEGAFCVAVDRFWQNFPKAFEAGGSNLRTCLWPSFGNGPRHFGQWGNLNSPSIDPVAEDHYRFEGGRWKTHRLTFDFKAAGESFTSSEVLSQARRLEKPLMAVMTPSWTAQTFAFGQPIIDRRNWGRTAHDRYEQMVQVLADDSAADPHPNWGQVGLPGFRARGGTYGGDQFYGWCNFGDIVWGDGFCSNHYDMPWGVLVNYYRTGDYSFFDVGRDLAAHRRDYDQFHSTDPNANKRGGQFYEKGWTHGNYQAPTPSHTWVHGLLLAYVMTGDEGSYEAALEVGDFILRQQPENWNGLYGARILGWQVEGLMHLWNYVGDVQYRQRAALAIGNWEQLELSQGAQGFVKNFGWSSQPHAQSWMHAIVMAAVGKYYLQTLDPSVLPVMNRMANYFQNDVIATLPTGPEYSRTKGFVWERFDGSSNWDGSSHHKWATVEALSYGAIALHRADLMQSARMLFESVTRYQQSSVGDTSPTDYTDPSTFDRIGFKTAQYPASETKVMSNIALWGHAFMAADALWDGTF